MKRLIVAVVLLVLVIAGVAVVLLIGHGGVPAVRNGKNNVTMVPNWICVPPKDYGEWMKAYGENEPDPLTQEGMDRLRKESENIVHAESELSRLLSFMPIVLTNATHGADVAFVSDVDGILRRFSRRNRARLLDKVGLNGEIDNMLTDGFLRALSSNEAFQLAVERYYFIAGKFADMIWELGGEEFSAAEADRRLYVVLRSSVNVSAERSEFILKYIERWKAERCDDESSNFCRSHRMSEGVYKRYFAESAKTNPRVSKAVSSWYPRHLVWARSILGREPRWSPDFKEN